MLLPASSPVASRLLALEETGSTNDELVRRATGADAASWPPFSVVMTTSQTAGRGRLGRVWTAPPGQTLAASVLVRPTGVPVEQWGWFPLIAGVAMAESIDALLPAGRASVKWPNDVLIADRKVCGILTELLPGAGGLVIGAGVNLTIPADGLPTPTATSLAIEGVGFVGDELVDQVLAEFLRMLRPLCDDLIGVRGDPDASGVRRRVIDRCGSIGRGVRVELPDGSTLQGTAVGIDRLGRLEVRGASESGIVTVAAGDVTHLRYE